MAWWPFHHWPVWYSAQGTLFFALFLPQGTHTENCSLIQLQIERPLHSFKPLCSCAALHPLMNSLNCLMLHCSPSVLVVAKGFSHLASLCNCCLTPNSSICICCHWDWWLKQQRRRRSGVGEGGQQSKEARRWLRDFQALPPLVASLPVCRCDRQSADSSAPYQTPLLVSARSSYSLSWPRQKRVLRIGISGQFRC